MEMKTVRKLLYWLQDFIPSSCDDCGVKMKRSERVLMASCTGAGIGVYYKGKGICRKCLDKRFEEALDRR
jgi:hypothetical protein